MRHIFARYIALGSVYALQLDLAADGIRTKARVLSDGRPYGDKNFSRGALYQMLRNRLYLGEIVHRGQAYPGDHSPIIDRETFERVGGLLDGNRIGHKLGGNADHPSLLAGIIWDGDGRRMTPNHANKQGVRYRYYISRKDKQRLGIPVWRVPAGDIENLIVHQVHKHTGAIWEGPSPSRDRLLELVERVTVHSDRIAVQLTGREQPISVSASLIRRSGERRIATPPENFSIPRPDRPLIKLIVRAHQARKALGDPANRSLEAAADSMGLSQQYFCALVRFSLIAPDIISTILAGRQPTHINRQFLARVHNLPIAWASQREVLGFT